MAVLAYTHVQVCNCLIKATLYVLVLWRVLQFSRDKLTFNTEMFNSIYIMTFDQEIS